MTEHTILVAFTVEGADRASAEADLHYGLRGALAHPPLTSWWVAEDDRHDGSDNDSAVFVTPGAQYAAARLLMAHGLTPSCNGYDDVRNAQFEAPEEES